MLCGSSFPKVSLALALPRSPQEDGGPPLRETRATMAAFDAQYDAQAAWEERLFATVPQPAQVREAADMQSAKVSVLGKGTVVQVLDRCVLDNGTVRVRVAPAEDAGLGGWLSAKVLGDWRALPPSRGAIKRLHYGWKAGSEFSLVSSKTPDGGVFFLRGVVGADPTPGAPAPTVVVFAHGGGYNLGVWIPVIEHLHVLWREAGETYEVVALDWIGHGHGRRLPGEGTAADRFDIAALGPDDVFAVLDDAGADDARFATAGRRVVGVGHSNGGMILALSEQRRPGAFAGLILFEPIIYDADALGTTASDNFLWLEGMAAKRKYEFEVGREDNFGVASRYFDKALMGWEAGAKRCSGREKGATFPPSKAPISAGFHSFRLFFGRAIILRSALEAWMLSLERARAEHSR